MCAPPRSRRSPGIVAAAALTAALATLTLGSGMLLAKEANAYAATDTGSGSGNAAAPQAARSPPVAFHRQKARLVATFRNTHGRLCRVVQRSVVIDGASRRAIGTVCRRSNGHWTLMRPPPHTPPSNPRTAVAGPG